jgi:hypothetical protein
MSWRDDTHLIASRMAWYMFIFRVSWSNGPEDDPECLISAASSHLIPGTLSAESRVGLRKVEDATPGRSPSGFTVAMKRLWLMHVLLHDGCEISSQRSGAMVPETGCMGRRARRGAALAILTPLSIGKGSASKTKR